MTSIDIVIPCAGRAHDLLRLLTSIHTLCAESLTSLCATITVSDDRWSATLRDQVFAAFPAVRYVAGPARGPAANRNNGSIFGDAEWLLFLDDDCYLQGDLLKTYADRVAVRPEVEVVEGAIHAVGERPNGNHHAPLNTTGGVLWSCNLLIRRRVFEAVGRFDEEFPFACLEDCDLAVRLKASRARIEFAADAIVFHPWRSVSESEVSRAIISHAIYAQKHPEFAHGFDFMHLLRALRGRVRQYRLGHFSSIPAGKYRTVAFDVVAPVLVYFLMRFAVLGRALSNRYRNHVPLSG